MKIEGNKVVFEGRAVAVGEIAPEHECCKDEDGEDLIGDCDHSQFRDETGGVQFKNAAGQTVTIMGTQDKSLGFDLEHHFVDLYRGKDRKHVRITVEVIP